MEGEGGGRVQYKTGMERGGARVGWLYEVYCSHVLRGFLLGGTLTLFVH